MWGRVESCICLVQILPRIFLEKLVLADTGTCKRGDSCKFIHKNQKEPFTWKTLIQKKKKAAKQKLKKAPEWIYVGPLRSGSLACRICLLNRVARCHQTFVDSDVKSQSKDRKKDDSEPSQRGLSQKDTTFKSLSSRWH